jgi:hypothetical protein
MRSKKTVKPFSSQTMASGRRSAAAALVRDVICTESAHATIASVLRRRGNELPPLLRAISTLPLAL